MLLRIIFFVITLRPAQLRDRLWQLMQFVSTTQLISSLCGVPFFKMQYMPGGFYASIYNQTANLSSYLVSTNPETIANSLQSFHPYYFNPVTYVCPVYKQPVNKTGCLTGMSGLPTGESCDNCCSFSVCLCSQNNLNSCFPLSNLVGLLHVGPEVLRRAHVSL